MKDVLQRAKREIESLRRRNEVLEAKSQVLDTFSVALLGVPRNGGCTEDIAWLLQKEIDEMEKAKAPIPVKAHRATVDIPLGSQTE